MKNWRKKITSVLLAFVMTAVIIPTLFATPAYAVVSTSWTRLGGSTSGQTLGTNGTTSYYYITEDTICTNNAVGGSGLTIADGATVYLYIPADVTLNVKGGNGANAENGGASTAATFTYYTFHSSKPYDITNFPSAATLNTSGKGGNGATGGGAGIFVPANAKLVVYGDGTLNATGGNGGKAGNGAEGNNDLYWYITNYNPNTTGKEHTWYETNIPNCPVPVFTCSFYKGTWNRWSYAVTGAGGAGGGGAAGGGAAIGSSGASGNSGVAGANGRGAVTDGSSAIIRAVASENNTTAPSATSAGTVYIASSVKTTLIGGQGGAAGTRPAYVPNTSHSFREYGSGASYTTGNRYFNNSHGQSGGAGACGGKGASIGMGGGGGAGGAGGDSGEMIYTSATTPAVPNQGANGQVSGAVGAENANTTLSEADMVYCNIVMAKGTDTTYPVGVAGSFTVPAADADGAPVTGWKVTTPAMLLPTAKGSSISSKLAVADEFVEANSNISTAEIIGNVCLSPVYTVTLNNGGGSGDGSVTATYDAYLPDVTVPTWENHVFYGYFTEADGKGVKYIDETGKGVKAWDLTADTTLYAFWKDSAKIESMDLLLGGDIGLRYHVAVNDPELQQSGAMTVSIGSKKPSETTVPYSEAPKDESGAILFPFTVSSIQMAELVKVEFKDKDGKVFASDAKSVEDYYNLVENSSATGDQKEMVRTLVNYGYHAQQALSKTNGWSIGTDYKASSPHGSLSSTANDLKAYKPVISGSDPNVKDIQLSLLLDNKTTLCIYVQTKDGSAPAVTVDGASVTPEDNGDSWWLVRIPNIDALNLSAMHTVEVNGYTVYLSALSYASVAGKNTIDAMRALLDYYQATLTANGKKMLTSATVKQNEYDYTGEKIEPELTVKAGDETVTDFKVEWNGNLTDAGTYTGLVTKDGYVGGVTVKVTIKPVKVEAPIVRGITKFTYNGMEQFFLATPLVTLYTLENNSATDAGEYTATARLMDEKNTCWTDGTTEPKTYDWWIDPMEVPVPHVEKTEFTYDGTQKTVLTVDEVNSYTVTGNTGTEAGDYEAIVELKDKKNNCWNDEGKTTEDKTIEWSIVIVKTKVEKPKVTGETSFAYDGTAKTLEIATSDDYTVTGNTGTDAGEYTATVTLKDTEKYCWSDDSPDPIRISWTITKKEIAVPTAVTGLVYNGTEQTGVNGGDGYTLSGTTKATNAGSYTATATLTDPTNTCWSDNSTDVKTIEWSIDKADPAMLKAVIVTYHPNGGSAEFSGSMNVEGTFSYDPDNDTTTFTPNDTQNYNTVTEEADVTEDQTVNTVNVPLQ